MLQRIVMVGVASALLYGAAQKAHAQGMIEQKVMQLDRDWAQALVKGDVAAVDRIEAADYLFTGPDGKVTTKGDDLSDLKTGNLKIEAIDFDDTKAHVYGDAAVVTGKMTIKNGMYHGQDISGNYRFTDVFAKVNGHWKAIASQSTMLPKQ